MKHLIRTILLVAAICLAGKIIAAEPIVLHSPNGKLQMTFSLSEKGRTYLHTSV